jgi:hypothetical protein|tara:strand:+ start:126 stop:719 length:594 start_codon:yes stop_codon:yes gene_type:complete
MSINLNDESYNVKDSGPIFNGGVAGIAENVTMSIIKRKADDKDGAPEYKLVFTDDAGASCNTAFWYITEDTAYDTVDQQITKKGKVFKHLLHAMYGADYQIPNFKDAKEMLDVTMKLLREGLPSSGKFRIFANYGAKISPKGFIQPRSWVPFMEKMTVGIESTRLVVGDIDCMERLQADTVGKPAAASTTADDDDWD